MINSVNIFGDSWSYCSYNKGVNNQEVPGDYNFTDLFARHKINCVNYSIPGASNQQILSAVKQNSNTCDLTIIFQTDPIRDLFKPSKQRLELIDNMPDYLTPSLDQYCELLLRDFYQNLDQATPGNVLLIGGLAPLYTAGIPSRFNYIESSCSELIDNGFKDCYYEWVNPSLILFNYLNRQWRYSLSEFETIENRILNKNFLWQTNKHFGYCHLGDLGYQTVFDIVLTKVKEY